MTDKLLLKHVIHVWAPGPNTSRDGDGNSQQSSTSKEMINLVSSGICQTSVMQTYIIYPAWQDIKLLSVPPRPVPSCLFDVDPRPLLLPYRITLWQVELRHPVAFA